MIDYPATDFTEAVNDVDVVLDIIGGDYPAKALDVLKPGGTLVSTLPPTSRRSQEERPSAASAWPALLVEADRLGMSALADLAATGKLSPHHRRDLSARRSRRSASAKAGPGKPSSRL